MELAVRLPQHPQTERAILGAVIVDNTALTMASQVLSVCDFSVVAHRHIFAAMLSLAARAEPIELLSLWDVLSDNSEVIAAGGAAFIASLGDRVHRDAPIDHWARMVKNAAILRQMAYEGESLTRAALEPHAETEEIAKRVQTLANSLCASLGGDIFGVLASEVKPEHVKWLWAGRIPLGKITALDGDPGLGKSALTLDLAARTTTGSPMPDGSAGVNGGVLVISAEDGPADTIVPRLLAVGANPERVRILKTIRDSHGERHLEIPSDVSVIERAAKSVEAKMIIIDPLVAFLAATVNSFSDQNIRRALAPLSTMAERMGAAVLIVRHLNKNSDGSPIYRGGGSIGIIGAARSGLLVARDPDDETGVSRILASTKSNLGPSPVSFRYTLQPHLESIRVCWGGESSHQATDLLVLPSGEQELTTLEEAGEFLRAILEEGALPAKDVFRKIAGAGFSNRTVKRPKTVIGIVAYRSGFGAGSAWVWKLPTKGAKPPMKDATTPDLASFEQTIDSTSIKSSTSPKSAKQEELATFAEKRSGIEEDL